VSRSGRNPDKRVRTAKKRTQSQVQWLQRQLNDPYVKQAKPMAIAAERLTS
jgi:23S rRNA (uridine2552-2'-O)-methyltransferase